MLKNQVFKTRMAGNVYALEDIPIVKCRLFHFGNRLFKMLTVQLKNSDCVTVIRCLLYFRKTLGGFRYDSRCLKSS